MGRIKARNGNLFQINHNSRLFLILHNENRHFLPVIAMNIIKSIYFRTRYPIEKMYVKNSLRSYGYHSDNLYDIRLDHVETMETIKNASYSSHTLLDIGAN